MNTTSRPWYAVGLSGETSIVCAACGRVIELGHMPADHHPSHCPACGVESLFFDWDGRAAQVVVGAAPPALAVAIRWAQDQLDELDFAGLLCAFEELAAGLAAVPAPAVDSAGGRSIPA